MVKQPLLCTDKSEFLWAPTRPSVLHVDSIANQTQKKHTSMNNKTSYNLFGKKREASQKWKYNEGRCSIWMFYLTFPTVLPTRLSAEASRPSHFITIHQFEINHRVSRQQSQDRIQDTEPYSPSAQAMRGTWDLFSLVVAALVEAVHTADRRWVRKTDYCNIQNADRRALNRRNERFHRLSLTRNNKKIKKKK